MPSFFSYNLYLRDKSRSFFAHRTIFCKKCSHKQFFLKLAERWRINIYVVWKTTIVPLSVCRVFLVIICICVTNHVLFLLTGRYFVKNAYISNFFSKMAERWGINIYVVWKTTIVPLSVCWAFLGIIWICARNHVLFLLTGRYFVKNAYISNFSSNWRNAGV